MTVCLCCGKEAEECLCRECRQKADIEDLCNKIRDYTPKIMDNSKENAAWEEIATLMEQPSNFKNIAFALADYLPSPRKEYQQILCIVGNNSRVPRTSKKWYREIYEQIINREGLHKAEVLWLKGLMLETLYQDYQYSEADVLAAELMEEESLPGTTACVLAEFFSQTRRYDEANDIIMGGMKENAENKSVFDMLLELQRKNDNRRIAADSGKKEYFPNPKEDKEEAIKKYTVFMNTLGIDVTGYTTDANRSKCPIPIPKEEYPQPSEKREADFENFVAFDFETTGRAPGTDSIIEVGAIKVINGQIAESAEYTFQEFVKPFKKGLSEEIIQLTGITKENVKDARQMWEVIPDFMKFVGEDILVGYNSIGFDAKFLCRAGRYSHEIYRNKHFDVWRYIQSLKDDIHYTGTDFKLTTVGQFLGIENPEAHRALADAITTAKIYLSLKEISKKTSEISNINSVLDLEEW